MHGLEADYATEHGTNPLNEFTMAGTVNRTYLPGSFWRNWHFELPFVRGLRPPTAAK